VWSTALRNLTNAPPEIKSRAWNAGAVQVLVAAMRRVRNVVVQREASAALQIMTMDRSEEDMLTAWEAGVVEAVVAAAREYVENEAMQAQACGVLSSVVYDATGESYQTWAGAAGAVEVVVVASCQHVGSARVQHLAYAGLARMVYRRAANK